MAGAIAQTALPFRIIAKNGEIVVFESLDSTFAFNCEKSML